MDRIWKMSLLIVSMILADQFSKGAIQSNFELGESFNIIPGFFNFTYVQNKGIAFGMFANLPSGLNETVLLWGPVLICFWLVGLIWAERHRSLLLCTAYSLVLSGAIGNLIDRFSLRYVVDFLDFFYGTSHFATFNIADTVISIGGGLLVIDMLFFAKKREEQEKNSAAQA